MISLNTFICTIYTVQLYHINYMPSGQLKLILQLSRVLLKTFINKPYLNFKPSAPSHSHSPCEFIPSLHYMRLSSRVEKRSFSLIYYYQ